MPSQFLRRGAALILSVWFSLSIASTFVKAQNAGDIDTLKRQVQQLDQAGKYAEALVLQRRVAAAIEKAEIARTGRAGAKTVDALVSVSTLALVAHDFRTALAASSRAHALAPANLFVETKRAHALLFSGRIGEASALYRAYKGKPMSLTSHQLWEDVIADDIELLQKNGLDHRAFRQIESELGGKSTSATTDLAELFQTIQELDRVGNYQEAETAAERYVVLVKRQYPEGHPEFAIALSWLGRALRNQGRHAEAEPLMQRALAIDEKALGPDHPDVGAALDNLADLYRDQGRYAEAEPLMKRALAIDEKALGPDHPDVGKDLDNLADLYRDQGRYAEAEPLMKRALAIAEKALGPDDPTVGTDLGNLAVLYYAQGRYPDAEPLFKRVLAIDEKALGLKHPDVAKDLNNLADLYRAQGRYAEAEPLMKRALAIDEKALGPDHPDVGAALDNLADLYRDQGRYAEAEPLMKRALSIDEKALGPDHPTVGTLLNNLAQLYETQGRDAETEPLMKRALSIDEKALGPDHPAVGTLLNNLGGLYRAQGRDGEAEPLFKRALAIDEKALGPDHPTVGTSLSNLAQLYQAQGRYADAEPLFRRALAIAGKALGPDHPAVGTSLNNLAGLYYAQGRYADAEPLLKRALAIDEKALGPDHPDVGKDLNNLAMLYFSQSDWVRAADFWRESTNIIIRRAQRGTLVGEALTGKRQSEAAQLSWQFSYLVKMSHRIASERHDEMRPLRDMFQTAQWAQSSEAAESLAQMAARGAKGDPKLATLVRERQDLVAEWQRRDQLRSAAVAQASDERNREAEAKNVARLAAIDGRIAIIDKELAANFPDYAALASPAPLSVEDVQAQLGADEALVLFLDTPEWPPTPEETFIWVVTKTNVRWVRSELGTSTLTREISALRCGLDYQGSWTDSHCADLLKVAYTHTDHDVFGKPLPFDLARAHELHKGLFGQIEDLIEGKRLLIVPSGALAQLPFQVLVTAPPKTALPSSAADYRDVAWLARRHAITVLPAVSSLKALRELAKQSHASEPYIGFGNPLLDGPDARYKKRADEARAKQTCADVSERAVAAVGGERGGVQPFPVRGGLANVAQIRAQVPLPETADELCEVARDLGSKDVRLAAAATEAEVKRLSETGELSRYRVIHFATHGALAGQVSGNVEPGLLLTPPYEATETDDGYLTASEIAGLKLDADWVILSACNTAAGGTQGGEALSGLARAFFYAGARSLLVSHWEVSSESTVKLITKAFAELNADPKIDRAEALQNSMLDIIDNGKTYEAHPAFWAPFVLVGEGAGGR
jgi:tetratricopeptide (TPR) repeat protein